MCSVGLMYPALAFQCIHSYTSGTLCMLKWVCSVYSMVPQVHFTFSTNIRLIYTEIGQDNLHKLLVNSYTKDLKSNSHVTYIKSKTATVQLSMWSASKQTLQLFRGNRYCALVAPSYIVRAAQSNPARAPCGQPWAKWTMGRLT